MASKACITVLAVLFACALADSNDLEAAIVALSGSNSSYSALFTAIQVYDLLPSLKDAAATGPITLFAPNNDVLAFFTKTGCLPQNASNLTEAMLSNVIIGGAYSSAQLLTAAPKYPTASFNTTLQVNATNGSLIVQVVGAPAIQGATDSGTILDPDKFTRGQVVVHGINMLLVPASLFQSVANCSMYAAPGSTLGAWMSAATTMSPTSTAGPTPTASPAPDVAPIDLDPSSSRHAPPGPTATSSSPATPSPTPANSTPPTLNVAVGTPWWSPRIAVIGAAVGGTAAGALLVGLLLTLVFCRRRKARRSAPLASFTHYGDEIEAAAATTNDEAGWTPARSGPIKWVFKSFEVVSESRSPVGLHTPMGDLLRVFSEEPPVGIGPPVLAREIGLDRSSSSTNKSTRYSRDRAPSGATVTPSDCSSPAAMTNVQEFSLEELRRATNGFDVGNQIGHGGFSTVYKGQLVDGSQCAVKRMNDVSDEPGVDSQITAELVAISKVRHRNLVSLVGYSMEGGEKLLVYEYFAKGSLWDHLHERKEGEAALDWHARLKIAHGVARGLAYLHYDIVPQMVHRDVKSSNVLLDEYGEAHLIDFGFARLVGRGFSHLTTRHQAGTPGYMAPEYAYGGRYSASSDVYSFGVLLLELVSGRPAVRTPSETVVEVLVKVAKHHVREGRGEELIDACMGGKVHKQIGRVVSLALRCVQSDAASRPTMQEAELLLRNLMLLQRLAHG